MHHVLNNRIQRICIAQIVSAVLFAMYFFCMHTLAFAADEGGDGGNSPTGLINPLAADTIPELLFAILDILLVFAYPVVIFFIVYAGFKFVTAQGDTGKLAEARSAFMWAVVGGVIVLGAQLLVTVIQGTVDAFK